MRTLNQSNNSKNKNDVVNRPTLQLIRLPFATHNYFFPSYFDSNSFANVLIRIVLHVRGTFKNNLKEYLTTFKL